MKIKNKIILGLLLSTSVFFTGCSANSGSSSGTDKAVKIVVNNHAPATHPVAVGAAQPWEKLVEEKSNGKIDVEIHDGAVLGAPDSIYDDVKGGLFDFSYASTDYHYDTELFPWTIADLPFVYSDPEQTQRIVSKVAEEFGLEKLNENVKYVSTGSRDPNILISTKPINSFEDIKGKRIIVKSRVISKIVEEWGATPVSISYGESYEALQRGTADAIIYTATGSVGMKYYEVAPYYVENLSITNGALINILNKNTFEKLPEELKETFENELGPDLGNKISKVYKTQMAKYKEEIEPQGAEFITLPDEELEKFKKAGNIAWQEWIDLANKKGYQGEEIIKTLIKTLEDEGVNVDFLDLGL